jgi:hypothetical protein
MAVRGMHQGIVVLLCHGIVPELVRLKDVLKSRKVLLLFRADLLSGVFDLLSQLCIILIDLTVELKLLLNIFPCGVREVGHRLL